MRQRAHVILGGVLACMSATSAFAQPAPERVRVSVNGGYQGTRTSFDQSTTFQEFAEEGTLTASYDVPHGPAFDGGVLVRVWRQLWAGASVSYFSRRHGGPVTAKIPHPFFFERQREVAGTAAGLARVETGLHAQIGYLLAPGGPMEALVSAGPSLFAVQQDLAATVNYSHTYPYDTATLQSVSTDALRETAVGVNAGIDLAFRLTGRVRLGAALRYARAVVVLAPATGSRVSADVGGFQAGAGFRLIF